MVDSQKIRLKILSKYAKLTLFIFLLLLGIIPQTPHIPASDNTVSDPLFDPLQWEPFTGVSAQPASFELSGLTVNPAVVEANSPTTITVNVENTGGISGFYNVELKLDGVPEASKRIILDGGAKTSVSFNVTKSCPKFYTIYVGPLTGTLEVVPPSEDSTFTIDKAIVVPTDVKKIDYPSAFNNPNITRAELTDPYIELNRDEIAYPVDYLGDYEYPPVNGAPLPAEIKRVVGFHDVGIPDGSLMDFTYNVTEKMRNAFLNTMKHAQSLGADEITFANYILFSDYEKAELEPLTNSALQPEDFRFIAVHAKELGLNTTLYLNLGPESSYTRESSPGIPSGDWLATQVRNWGPFVLEQAKLCEETGVDAMMINHLDWDPSVKGYEDVYQAEMLALLSKVRTVYHGRVLMVINPFWGADLNKLSRLLGSVDGFIYDALIKPFWETGDKTVSVSNVKALYLKAFRNLSEYFSGFSKPYLIRLLIQSEKTFLENGWNEDMFRVRRGDDPYYQRNLEVDFSVQAIAYEAALEAVKQAHADRCMEVYGVDATGYLFMDVILPYISQPQISQSVRNKPAEAVVYQWFKHPAAILLRSLLVSKSLVKSGEEVTVNATLENSGDLPGIYTLVFSLDGIQKDLSTVTLDGGKTVTKTMKFSSSVEGTHTVTVGSESVVFNVEKTPVAQTGIDGYPIESVFIGLMLIIVILVANRKNQNVCRLTGQ